MFEIKNKKKLYSDNWHIFGNRSSDKINHSKNTEILINQSTGDKTIS